MPYLVAAVLVVGLLGLLNLLLTIGVIRRLRQMAARPPFGAGFPAAGTTVSGFTATTTDGETVDGITQPAIVAFFTPGCAPCESLLPRFVSTAEGATRAVLSVIVGDELAAEPYVNELKAVGQVVAGEQGRLVADAFGVAAYPAVCLVGADGVIEACDGDLTVLR